MHSPNFVFSTDNVPSGFTILSTTPALRIKYRLPRTIEFWLWAAFFMIMSLPFWLTFIGFVWLLIVGTYKTLQLGFWQSIQNFLNIVGEQGWKLLPILISLMLVTFVTRLTLQILLNSFTTTEFQAFQETLIVSHQVLRKSSNFQISSHTIQYFKQFNDKDGNDTDFWSLEIITNQLTGEKIVSYPSGFRKLVSEDEITRRNYKTMELFSDLSIEKSTWLGNILADFYKVEFRPARNMFQITSDYTQLRDLLVAQKWKEADDETAKIMLKVARREEEGWLDYESIAKLPCVALGTIDQLWVQYSNGRFGFSVQKNIWIDCGGKIDYETELCLGKRVGWYTDEDGWRFGDRLNFSLDAPSGHLPNLFLAKRGVLLRWIGCVEVMCSSLALRFQKCGL